MEKLNKKGFTLIELLAVIIVLGVIMVVAIPSVLSTMNNAKEKSFKIYSQRILSKTEEQLATDEILGSTPSTKTKYSLADLGFTNTGTYDGCVTVEKSGDTSYNLTVYLTDGTYCFESTGAASDTLDNAIIKSDDTCKANGTNKATAIMVCEN